MSLIVPTGHFFKKENFKTIIKLTYIPVLLKDWCTEKCPGNVHHSLNITNVLKAHMKT
jgi:hypothetical protein